MLPTSHRARVLRSEAALLGLAASIGLAALLGLPSCGGAGEDGTPELYLGEGTRRMAARLGEVTRRAEASAGAGFDASGVEQLRRELIEAQAFGPADFELVLEGYRALLRGENEAAVERFLAVRAHEDELSEDERRRLTRLLAVSYLRLGEQENCVEHRGSESCLFPIRAAGVHAVERGSRAAIVELERLLEHDPEDLGSRWLLNLACMTLGEYPAGVPERWRIEPERFASEHEVPRLADVAGGTDLAVIGLAGGAAVDDFDGDGYLDVVTSSCGPHDPLRFLHSNGDGSFVDRTESAGFIGLDGGINLCHADYDNDGDNDVLVLRGGWLFTRGLYPNSLLRNNGDGTFDDVTEEAGLLAFEPTHSAAWADYDGDGWLDLFVGNESSPMHSSPSRLYRNDGNGGFVDVTAEVGLAVDAFVKGVAWGDYDDDGREDLFVATLGGPNFLFRNTARNGRVRFRDVTAHAGVERPYDAFATWFFDYDADGRLDLFAAGFSLGPSDSIDAAAGIVLGLDSRAARARLFHNEGDRTFRDVSAETGIDRIILVMGANHGDLDGDGYEDLYVGTGEPSFQALVPNRMLRNAEGHGFQDVTTAAGMGHLQKGHGIAFADIDNDGDQDVYAALGGWYSGDVFRNALFENPGSGSRWLTLRLEGVASNRSAIGARIRARIEEDGGERDVFARVGTGGSFGSNSLQAEIGLGAAKRIVELEIRWPAGTEQRFEDVPLDRMLALREGDDELRPVELARLDLSPDVP